MSATNKTTYYELPIFIGTDVPSWLGDWNNTMNALDTAINGVKNSADNALSVANTAEGKSDGNTESIEALNTEVQTLKAAVQNYDAILNFSPVALVTNPNNVASAGNYMVQNTNKTLNRLYVSLTMSALSNPTTFNYTTESSGTSTWYDLFTVEDNCFNLQQSSLPNYEKCLTCGPLFEFSADGTGKYEGAPYLRTWYDGATTHFGICTNRGVTGIQNDTFGGNFTVFLSGNVYNPDDTEI